MISLLKPTTESLHDVLVEQKDKNVTYDLIQGTLDHREVVLFKKDPKYSQHNIDFFKIKIGEGSTFFDLAVEGLKQFKVILKKIKQLKQKILTPSNSLSPNYAPIIFANIIIFFIDEINLLNNARTSNFLGLTPLH
jgi:hypothetical protein